MFRSPIVTALIAVALGIGSFGAVERAHAATVPVPAEAAVHTAVEGAVRGSIAAGFAHSCGIRPTGTIACWGAADHGRSHPPAGTFIAVSAGDAHSCAIRTDASLACWGSNDLGQAAVPPGLFSAVAAGFGHTCAIAADGAPRCWGANTYGQVTPPAGEQFSSIAAGADHSCALRANGTVVCWGRGDGRTSPPFGASYRAISAGRDHTCGIQGDGRVSCWGAPLAVLAPPPDDRFSAVAAGVAHTCGIVADGGVSCWGSNEDGRSAPPAGARFIAVAAGGRHSCGIRSDGRTSCWGADNEGQTTVPLDGTFHAIQPGSAHTCGLRADGSAVCWGDGSAGQDDAPAGESLADLSAGGDYTCGLRVDATVACWGDNSLMQLNVPPGRRFTAVSAGHAFACGILRGNPGAAPWGLLREGEPVCWGTDLLDMRPPADARLTFIDTGGAHACGLTALGDAVCWGRADEGQASPPAGVRFASLSSGATHTCGLMQDGMLRCWGETAPPPSGSFVAVAAGRASTCALRPDGSVVCWGDNSTGQANVPSGTTLAAIAAGPEHVCGVRPDGSGVCWGDDHAGRTQVPGGVPITLATPAVSTNEVHTCAIQSNGSASCWGLYRDVSPNSGGFSKVATGQEHACALRADGSAACWGSNGTGQSDPPGGVPFVDIAAGVTHSCGVNEWSGPICWGGISERVRPPQMFPHQIVAGDEWTCARGYDQQDSGTFIVDCGPGFPNRPSPIAGATDLAGGGTRWCMLVNDGEPRCYERYLTSTFPSPAGPLVAVAANTAATCGLRASDHVAVCTGDATKGGTPIPGRRYSRLTMGERLACGNSDGVTECWGAQLLFESLAAPSAGGGEAVCGIVLAQPGSLRCIGSAQLSAVPGVRASAPRFKKIDVSPSHTCAIRDDGAAECWGDDAKGQSSPPASARFLDLAVGGKPVTGLWYLPEGGHSCGVLIDGSATCWGANDAGQSAPPSGQVFVAVTAGLAHTCALRLDRQATCWGANDAGQTTVPPGERFSSVVAGDRHTCGLRLDGSVRCWGADGVAEHGLPAGARFRALAASTGTCGVRADGAIACWGTTPAWDPPAGTFTALSIHTQVVEDRVIAHGCAIGTHGSIHCWGEHGGDQMPSFLRTPDAAPRRRALTVARTGPGSGRVSGAGGRIDCATACRALLGEGEQITLSADPAAGWDFAGWTGACANFTGDCTVTMSQAASVTARFDTVEDLTVTRDGNGAGTVSGERIDCGEVCSAGYITGTEVALTATAGANSVFTGWSGACTGSGDCTVQMSEARAVTATFVLVRHHLTVEKAGNGDGSVSGSGIDCGATCDADYDHGAVVVLTAAPAEGSTFAGWSGACVGTGSCTVTMDQARSVAATFTLRRYALTVRRISNGAGKVTGPGIDCGSTCTATYDHGSIVTLQATPAADSTFSGWWEADCGGLGDCVLTMNGPKSVSASFTLRRHTLSVARTGNGSGSVTASEGIDCGDVCEATYSHGTEVTLHAAPDPGSVFAGWSGACAGTGSCVVTMDDARAVAATFTLSRHVLTVIPTGGGDGTVTGDGIDCGTNCSNEYDFGTIVTLTAAAAPGSVFSGWSGACTGTGSCVITMDGARSVAATFTPTRHTLTVVRSGNGLGTVEGDGIDCGSSCSAQHDFGTVVSLTATASPGSVFSGWSGACTGAGACVVTMDDARTVGATFTLTRHTLTVARTGDGDGTVAGDGIDCGSTCSAHHDFGTVVSLTATPARFSVFSGWSGACSGTGACSVSMTEDRAVTARFTFDPVGWLLSTLPIPLRAIFRL